MRYMIDDGSILDPERSKRKWEKGTRWNGQNQISLATGSQWNRRHQDFQSWGQHMLYLVSKWW